MTVKPITRREALETAAALAVSAGALGPVAALAQEPRGPLVWLDMTQAELDAAYDQRSYAPAMADHMLRRARRNDQALMRLPEPMTFSYGDRPMEQLDVHISAQEKRPAAINVFFHGGAWRAGTARDHSYMAEPYVNAGAHCVVVDYSPVQDVGGDLGVLGDQARRAVAWVYENAAVFGGDANRIFVSGHSSGGHLAAVALTTDWAGRYGLPRDFIAGGFVASGMFDLKPVRLSSRREYVTITDAVEEDLSPMRHIEHLTAPLILAYGTRETPEFQRQTLDFAAAVRAAGKPVEVLVAEGYYHLEVAETLANPYGLLGAAYLAQMGLA